MGVGVRAALAAAMGCCGSPRRAALFRQMPVSFFVSELFVGAMCRSGMHAAPARVLLEVAVVAGPRLQGGCVGCS